MLLCMCRLPEARTEMPCGSSEVLVDSFYPVTWWDGKRYICQVCSPLCELFFHNLFVFPVIGTDTENVMEPFLCIIQTIRHKLWAI